MVLPEGKIEINIHRLLQRCEKMVNEMDEDILAQNPKFHSYVDFLQEQFATLLDNDIESSLSNEKAMDYGKRISALVEIKHKKSQEVKEGEPSIHDSNSDSNSNSNSNPNSNSNSNSYSNSNVDNDSKKGLRKRVSCKPSTASEIGGTKNYRNDPAQNENSENVPSKPSPNKNAQIQESGFQNGLDRNRRIQEDLSNQVLSMAANLKKNSLLMGDAIKESNELLNKAEHDINRSLISTNFANKESNVIYSRSFYRGCYSYLIMICIFVIFLWMLIFIKFSSTIGLK